MKKLEGCISVNFKKTRIKDSNVKSDSTLYDKMRSLKNKEDKESKKELQKTIEDIALAADNNFIKLKEELAKLKPEDGHIDSKLLWKLKKSFAPEL